MPRGRHSPTVLELVAALARRLSGGLVLIVVLAAAFWGVGQMRDGTGAADEPTAAESTETAPSDGATTAPDDPTPSPPAPPAETAAPSPTPTSTGTPAPAPAEVSVQILDAVIDDDGEAASAVAEQLRADGYDVVAENRAVRRYEQTTVFFTPGHEAEARQVADRYGFEVVQEKPDNLTDAVDIHVVVGADA